MPDLSHLWQRFLLATALLFGLLIGVVGTVFGYSNGASVNLHWSIFHLDGVPLWTVAIVPLALFLVAGTLYHWFNSLHHFTEHMRHRHRVHELEAEVATLREHLDHVLQMPDHSTSRLPAKHVTVEPVSVEPVEPVEPISVEPAASEPVAQAARPELAASNGGSSSPRKAEKRKVEPEAVAKPLPDPTADS